VSLPHAVLSGTLCARGIGAGGGQGRAQYQRRGYETNRAEAHVDTSNPSGNPHRDFAFNIQVTWGQGQTLRASDDASEQHVLKVFP
jgi:hypothetical protein